MLGLVLLALAAFYILAPPPAGPTSTQQIITPPKAAPDIPLKNLAATQPVTIRRISPLVPSLLPPIASVSEAPAPPGTASDLTADFDAYDRHIASLILPSWLPARGTEASARIEFSIAPTGQVVRARITKPTGLVELDATIRALIREMATIGKPLPAAIASGDYQIEVELRAE